MYIKLSWEFTYSTLFSLMAAQLQADSGSFHQNQNNNKTSLLGGQANPTPDHRNSYKWGIEPGKEHVSFKKKDKEVIKLSSLKKDIDFHSLECQVVPLR